MFLCDLIESNTKLFNLANVTLWTPRVPNGKGCPVLLSTIRTSASSIMSSAWGKAFGINSLKWDTLCGRTGLRLREKYLNCKPLECHQIYFWCHYFRNSPHFFPCVIVLFLHRILFPKTFHLDTFEMPFPPICKPLQASVEQVAWYMHQDSKTWESCLKLKWYVSSCRD